MTTPDERPLQCVDCGLILTRGEAKALKTPNGKVVYPLCGNHYSNRVDTIEGNP